MYFRLGETIYKTLEVSTNTKDHKKETLTSISKDLSREFGKGYSRESLNKMVIFYTLYKKCSALPNNISWANICELIFVKNNKEREFYQYQCVYNNWSQRQLRRQIKSCLYQRVMLAQCNNINEPGVKKPTRSLSALTKASILKEPIVLEFFKCKNNFLENDLERSIIKHMKDFMLELGQGFMFVGNQYHLSIGSKHYYVDLVFYNKILNSYVLIELKAKPVDHNAVGQINLYLNYFKEHINHKDDNDPIGIIMCTDKNNIEVKYALGNMSNQIFISKYITHLPKKEELEKELSRLLADTK